MSLTLMLSSISVHAQLNSSLLAYYPFDGNPNDISGNNYYATAISATLTSDRNAISNSAYEFNGSQSITLFPDNLFSSPDLSVSLWFLASSSTNPTGINIQRMYASGDTQKNRQNFSMNYNNNNNDLLDFRSEPAAPTAGMLLTYQIPLDNSIWHHLVVTRSFGGNQVRMYLDNVMVEMSSISFWPELPVPVNAHSIGSYPGGAQGFVGKIDDVGIWNRVLTPLEVDTLYKGASPVVVTSALSKERDIQLNIFPNPSSDFLNVNLESEEEITIWTTEGKICKVSELALKHRLDVSELPQGLYFIKAGNLTEKFLKK